MRKEVKTLHTSDLGNVIVGTGFNYMLGAWDDLTYAPLATPKKNFYINEVLHQHERGETSDEVLAETLYHEITLPLGREQFSRSWQAVFVALRLEVIAITHRLCEQGHRVVVLSNTNRLYTTFWSEEYPETHDVVDHTYSSQDLGMRKSEVQAYQYALQVENFSPGDMILFDGSTDNTEGINQLGITSILVKDKATIPDYSAKMLC